MLNNIDVSYSKWRSQNSLKLTEYPCDSNSLGGFDAPNDNSNATQGIFGWEPEIGDSIMVLKQPWLGHILRGQKTLEIRSRKHKTGMVWLAEGGQIYGRCNIEAAEELTIEEFRALEHQHLWPADRDPPYKPRLCGLQLADVHVLSATPEVRQNGWAGGGGRWDSFLTSTLW